MPIPSISSNVCEMLSCVVPSMHTLKKVLLLPFTKVLGQKDQPKKDSYPKSDERKVVSEFAILAEKWFKITM